MKSYCWVELIIPYWESLLGCWWRRLDPLLNLMIRRSTQCGFLPVHGGVDHVFTLARKPEKSTCAVWTLWRVITVSLWVAYGRFCRNMGLLEPGTQTIQSLHNLSNSGVHFIKQSGGCWNSIFIDSQGLESVQFVYISFLQSQFCWLYQPVTGTF